MFRVFKKSSVPSRPGHGQAHAGACCGGGHAREDVEEEQVREPAVSPATEPKPGRGDEPLVPGHHGHR